MIKHYRILLVIISFFLLAAFMPKKYSPGFKEAKKEIETLTILNSVVQIDVKGYDTEYIDVELADKNQKLIDSVTFKLLSRKYDLEKVHTPSMKMRDFAELFEQLEKSPNELDKISSKKIFNKQNTACKSKYVLWLVYLGQVNPDFPPHYKFQSAVISATIIVTPGAAPTQSDIRVLIIDTEQEEIVFYDKSTSKWDARLSADVVHLTKDILKGIYYK